MAAQRRSSRALCGIVLVAALAAACLATSCFVQPPAQAPRGQAPGSQAPVALGLTAASWLAASQPAFAEAPQYPGWPYLLIFVLLFSALFIIPNTIWK
mmetsp:Transcript_16592/g.33576  ORF Transcript_16592/g.33576 Transcript_16592/m.33576 type:complete len:98 (+) Transcript_16592:94-387(+)